MKKTVLKFGLYSFITATVLFLMGFLFGDGLGYSAMEIIGYTSMGISLIFVYFGIKYYRDKEHGGKINFTKALTIGILISLFAALGFGIVDYLYTTVINPDFADEYLTTTLTTMKEQLDVADFEVKKAELIQQMTDYGQPSLMALLMFVTVLIMGFVFSLISALILQKK
jgi:hypothetical protein